jgi:two-component system chemotaxis sensor kinase CheA
VDDLLGKQEVVIKNLGEGLGKIPGIAGGAILGDGRVGLILDMGGLWGVHAEY